MNTSIARRIRSIIAKAVVAGSLVGAAAVTNAAVATAEPDFNIPLNTCSPSCILFAYTQQVGNATWFHGSTRWPNELSGWLFTVSKDGVPVFESEEMPSNDGKYDVQIGNLQPGTAYQFSAHVGTTSHGEERVIQPFQTGPAVAVTPTATNVTLGFTMPVGVTARAWVYRKDGTGSTLTMTGNASKTQSLVSAALLAPSTSYVYQVDATDAQGRVYTTKGEFMTRAVRLEVTVTSLQINDDSDYFGAGELRAQLRLGANTTKWIWSTDKSVETATGPKYFSVNVSHALTSATATVPVSVTVSDNDCEGIGSLCTGGTGNLSLGSGSTGDAQWATASLTVTLPATTTSTPSTNFLISTTSGPVVFAATGTYRWVMV